MSERSRTNHTFDGRIRAKPEQQSLAAMVELLFERYAFVYKRLSSHEQIKKSIYSIAMQDALVDMAKQDGYQIEQIMIEERDLGFSGTLGSEDRKGLANLIHCIEQDILESVYVVHISRLFRDQTLIDGLAFGELCKEHNVILVMPNMRLNLRDKMHMRIYRMELERAADELELMKLRMGGARTLKARQGFYAGGSVQVGYYLPPEGKEINDKYALYEPHATIIRQIFEWMPQENFSPLRVARKFKGEGTVIPYFPPELQYMEGRSAARRMIKTERGYRITSNFVQRVCTNPVYVGWWIWGGEVVNKKNHPPIVDEDLFWQLQDALEQPRAKGRAVYSEPLVLQNLIFCKEHEERVRIDQHEKRYRCHGKYQADQENTYCFGTASHLLDKPITAFVVSQCSYPGYAEEVMKQLNDSYDEAKAKVEAAKREQRMITQEIATLKQNLAYTKTRQQAETILELIGERQTRLEDLSNVKNYPAARVANTLNIQKINAFLTNMKEIWDQQPNRFKNEFLKIILERIWVSNQGKTIRARIIWKTGLEQEIEIDRVNVPNLMSYKWTEEENQILRDHYATMDWEELGRLLPNRDYYAIVGRASTLGLRRARGTKPRAPAYTAAEDAVLQRVAAGEIKIEIACRMLNRTPVGVIYRMKQLRIYRNIFSERLRQEATWRVVDIAGGNQEQQSKK